MIHKKLKRPAGDIVRLIRGMGIGGRKDWDNPSIYADFFTLRDYKEIVKYFDWKKEDYIEYIRDYLTQHPFSSHQAITDLIARPASYMNWIITEMSFSESDLAETDNGELFLLSEKTIEMLDKRGEL